MTDEVQAAEEAAPEVVQTEAEQVEAPEAVESTEGQDNDQPAEGEAKAPEPEEEVSAAKARRERRKAERARLKTELTENQQTIARLEAEVERLSTASGTTPPKFEDFEDHDEYVAALSAHKAAEMMDKRRAGDLEREAKEHKQRAEALTQQQMREAEQNWAAQEADARTRYADFDAVIRAPDVPITKDMAELMAMSDVGADVAYYLGMNKDQARELAQMPRSELMGAMQMLERFVPAQTPRPRTQTNAPDPVNPVRPKATAAKKAEDMSHSEYVEWREKGGTFTL